MSSPISPPVEHDTEAVMAGLLEEQQCRCAAIGAKRPLRGAAIAGVGAALPSRVRTNAELGDLLGVSEEWIVKRTGIRERRVLADGESLTDLATLAAQGALAHADVHPSEVDMVLVATSSGDQLLPNTAPLVAHQLGTGRAAAADVGAACAGFLTTVPIAAGLVETGRCDVCVVIGAEAPSRHLAPDDMQTMPVMGDGAGAVVIAPTDGRSRIGPSLFRSDGAYAEFAYGRRDDQIFRMEGQEIFRLAVEELVKVTDELLTRADLSTEDVDLFVFHHANGRILQAVVQRLGIRSDQVVDCIARTGNTSAASIPIALQRAVTSGRIKKGTRVLTATIGAGFVWGACLIDWDEPA